MIYGIIQSLTPSRDEPESFFLKNPKQMNEYLRNKILSLRQQRIDQNLMPVSVPYLDLIAGEKQDEIKKMLREAYDAREIIIQRTLNSLLIDIKPSQ
jgi:hypothetical protein